MRILVVCSFLAIAMAKSASGPQVLTKNGYVQGKDEPGLNAPCEAFYGIPFAKPPIGSLRFQVRSEFVHNCLNRNMVCISNFAESSAD